MRRSFHCWVLSITFFMASCGQTNRQDKGEKETEKLLSETEQVNANRQLFILSEEVSDFNTWYRQFESDDYQLYNELFDNLTVYRGYNDDKFLMLTGNFAIEEDARIFLNNRKKQPQFYRVTWQGEEVPTTDHAFFVYQEVGDYLTWLEKFQEDDPRRKENGLYAMGVARNLQDPTKVVNYFAVSDVEQALAFINPQLTKIIESASVQGQPTLQIVRVVNQN